MSATNIIFHEITLADKEWMDARLAEDDRNACEYTFANNFIWRKVYQVEVAEICGCLIIRFMEEGKYCYSFPVGDGDKKSAIEQLFMLSKEAGEKLVMSPLSEADRAELLEWFPGQFLLIPDRDSFDYIYSREKLATLAGKKLHGKRNHIARFKDGDDWSYEPMTAENLEECRTMTYTWIKMRSEKWSEDMEEEVMVLHEAFDNMQKLGLVGGVLRKEGEIVAFTMGEPLNSDTFVVHFEKAFPDMQGAYPMVNQQFVQHACEGYEYVNREEDTGDLGLRKAKLSYYPEILLKKYIAVQNEIVYADKQKDGEQIKKIWATCFGDEEDYIQNYLDNRMTEDNMLVVYADGKAVSMASFLPTQYLCEEEYVDARYVYAVATLPEYRGWGFAGQILAFAKEYYKQPLILAPAEESLVDYYKKQGFVQAFPDTREHKRREDFPMKLSEAEEMAECYYLEPVSAKEYVKLRDARLAKEGYVRWDEAAVCYAMDMCIQGEGAVLSILSKEREDDEERGEAVKDILMYQKENNTLVIVETSCEETVLQEVLPYLMTETGTNEVLYGQMKGMILFPESMSNLPVCGAGYLALTLD